MNSQQTAEGMTSQAWAAAIGGYGSASIGLEHDPAFPEDDDIDLYENEDQLGQSLAADHCDSITACDAFCPTSNRSDASSEHFSLREFHSRDGVEVPEQFRGSIQTLMHNLEALRTELGGSSIRVVSGYRSCTHNCHVGGARRSRHLCGQAADIRVTDHQPEQVHAAIQRLIAAGTMQQGGLGIYNTFVHYDIRGTRARWDGRRATASSQSAYAMSGVRPWSDFFQFPAGSSFHVDGPLSYDGYGRVIERSNEVLGFEMHMPAKNILGLALPETDLTVHVTYRQEGAGNQARIVVNGNTFDDDNLTIRSDGNRRRMIPSISIPGQRIDEIAVEPDGDDEIDLDVSLNGSSHDFDLERTSTSSGVASSLAGGGLSAWQHLISFRPPTAIQAAIRDRMSGVATRDGWPFHPIEDGDGPVNLDYYPVKVTRLPPGYTAESLLQHWRMNINNFIDTRFAFFEPYDDDEARRWRSSSPLGTVVHIDMRAGGEAANPDDGSVVLTDFSPSHWIFSTIWAVQDMAHPVSGNRQFGFTRDDDGSHVFFTRGADRPTRGVDEMLKDTIFAMAHSLWLSLQQGLAEFVNGHGGTSEIQTATSRRHNWSRIKARYHRPRLPWRP